jgi:putative photosynthetic complex assembly protein
MSVDIHFEAEPGSNSAIQQLTPPKPALRVAIAMVVLTFVVAIAASQFGIGKSVDAYGSPVAQRALSFSDAPDGGIIVRDDVTGAVALTLPKGTNGFLRGALRGLAGRRRAAALPREGAFMLTAWEDGRITIDDPLTGERVSVSSFGPTQVRSFVALLDPAGKVFP